MSVHFSCSLNPRSKHFIIPSFEERKKTRWSLSGCLFVYYRGWGYEGPLLGGGRGGGRGGSGGISVDSSFLEFHRNFVNWIVLSLLIFCANLPPQTSLSSYHHRFVFLLRLLTKTDEHRHQRHMRWPLTASLYVGPQFIHVHVNTFLTGTKTISSLFNFYPFFLLTN